MGKFLLLAMLLVMLESGFGLSIDPGESFTFLLLLLLAPVVLITT
jgi:hypothetical protein